MAALFIICYVRTESLIGGFLQEIRELVQFFCSRIEFERISFASCSCHGQEVVKAPFNCRYYLFDGTFVGIIQNLKCLSSMPSEERLEVVYFMEFGEMRVHFLLFRKRSSNHSNYCSFPEVGSDAASNFAIGKVGFSLNSGAKSGFAAVVRFFDAG